MPFTQRDELRALLEVKLHEQFPNVDLYSNYYDGEHRLQFATAKFKEAFGDLFEAFSTNWCGLVVDVACDRLKVQGFRFGADEADEDANAIWQANNLDAKAIQVHTEAVKCGTGYLLVSPPERPGGQPRITVEHPRQVYVLHDPADRMKRLAAIKEFQSANGDDMQVVYEPDRITTYVRKARAPRLMSMGVYVPPAAIIGWEIQNQAENRLGSVPVIPLENAPNILTGGTSDLRPAINLNDAANKFFTDMIHASEYTSFPQRILTGVELPRDPITGEVLESSELRAAVSRLWVFEGDKAQAHQLAVGELGNYVEGVDMAVQHLAAQTRTPPHYLLAKLANISGEALITAEVGLVARCKRKHLDFSDPWEEALRLAFKWRAIRRNVDGNSAGAASDEGRAEMMDAETIWADPERQAPSTLADALIKKQTIGVPWEALMEEAGYSPQQIIRMRQQLADQKEAELARKIDETKRMADAMPKPDPAPQDRGPKPTPARR